MSTNPRTMDRADSAEEGNLERGHGILDDANHGAWFDDDIPYIGVDYGHGQGPQVEILAVELVVIECLLYAAILFCIYLLGKVILSMLY